MNTDPNAQPDSLGHWGAYGGRFVPETLMAPLEERPRAFMAARDDESFQTELNTFIAATMPVGPHRCFFAERLTEHAKACASI